MMPLKVLRVKRTQCMSWSWNLLKQEIGKRWITKNGRLWEAKFFLQRPLFRQNLLCFSSGQGRPNLYLLLHLWGGTLKLFKEHAIVIHQNTPSFQTCVIFLRQVLLLQTDVVVHSRRDHGRESDYMPRGVRRSRWWINGTTARGCSKVQGGGGWTERLPSLGLKMRRWLFSVFLRAHLWTAPPKCTENVRETKWNAVIFHVNVKQMW